MSIMVKLGVHFGVRQNPISPTYSRFLPNVSSAKIDVVRHVLYTFSAKQATKYAHGTESLRVFLAGDAAHAHPHTTLLKVV